MIIFVDDSRSAADLYVDELMERGLEVEFFDNVDDAWRGISSTRQPPEIVILDLMMPPGALLSSVGTSGGLITGLQLYRRIRSRFGASYIIALTNLSSSVIEEAFQGDRRAFVRRKDQVYYDEIADEVEALLGSCEVGREGSSPRG